jgi:sugar phosphate isomerase/epimerase
MKLGINTFIYELGKVSILESVKKISSLGFKYVDFVPFGSLHPDNITRKLTNDLTNMMKDIGLHSSQMLLLNTRNLTTSDPSERKSILDYLKRISDFQLLIGGKQVLICWGQGIIPANMLWEQAWVNSVYLIREFAEWAHTQKLLISLELDPGVYFLNNNLHKMLKIIEDIDMPNVFSNIDVSHLNITRESPNRLEKLRNKIIHIHISDCNGLDHTNSILGTGTTDIASYINKLSELRVEDVAMKYGEQAVAAIELGDPGINVDDPDRWVKDSIKYLSRYLPSLNM